MFKTLTNSAIGGLNAKNLIAGTLLGIGLSIASQAHATRTIDFAHALPANSHFSAGAQAFKKSLEEASNGAFKVVEHSAGSLGGERALIEGLQFGTVDLVLTSSGPLGNFVPQTYVFDLPFLFKDYTQARCVLDGDVGNDVLDMISKQGVKALALSEAGFRNVTNNVRSLREPGDFSGLKIRTMENQIHMDTFRALGAHPTPMAFPELFTALQQGTVDGQENPITVIVSARFSEVQKILSMTRHSYTSGALLISNNLYSSLDDKEKGWFEAASKASVAATRENISRMEEEGLALLKSQGMQVNDDLDHAALREKAEPVYQKFVKDYGSGLLDRIHKSECLAS